MQVEEKPWMGLFSPAGSEVALNLETQALESLLNVMSLTPKKAQLRNRHKVLISEEISIF